VSGSRLIQLSRAAHDVQPSCRTRRNGTSITADTYGEFALATIAALQAYDGLPNITMLAWEVAECGRNCAQDIIIGVRVCQQWLCTGDWASLARRVAVLPRGHCGRVAESMREVTLARKAHRGGHLR
jgi:hypothetical protein